MQPSARCVTSLVKGTARTPARWALRMACALSPSPQTPGSQAYPARLTPAPTLRAPYNTRYPSKSTRASPISYMTGLSLVLSGFHSPSSLGHLGHGGGHAATLPPTRTKYSLTRQATHPAKSVSCVMRLVSSSSARAPQSITRPLGHPPG